MPLSSAGGSRSSYSTKSTILSLPSSRRPSRNAPLSRLHLRPRSRSFAFRRRHRNHEQDSSCRGAKRRRIITGLKKFMDELQVLNNPLCGAPDLRRHLATPIVVPHQALAVTGQVEGGAVLPIGAEHRRSEEHTSELQSLMRISYAVFCLKKK